MKKSNISVFMVVIVTFILLAMPLSLYAKDDKEGLSYTKEYLLSVDNFQSSKEQLSKFEISGIDEKNDIKMFDEKKSFSGTAHNGAIITATTYTPDVDGEWKEAKAYTVTVGPSGIFSIDINFNLGESIVVMRAEKDAKLSVRCFSVSRKESEIRDKIKQQKLILPF